MVMGHEGAGIVESVGSQVSPSSLSVGDYVLTSFLPTCRECHACKNPLTNVCVASFPLLMGQLPNKKLAANGSAVHGFCGLGTYSEYVLVQQSQVVKVGF